MHRSAAQPAVAAGSEEGRLCGDVDVEAVADRVDGGDKGQVRAAVQHGGGAGVLRVVEIGRRLDADLEEEEDGDDDATTNKNSASS